jgi:hypothetical protein
MNLLVSYAYIQTNPAKWIPLLSLWASKGLRLLIDSGAFSASNAGTKIDHTEYIRLAKQLTQLGPNVECIQLDVIRDPKATRGNLLREYSEGLKTIPVLTHNERVSEFAYLAENFNTRICVAGAVNNTPQWTIDRIAKCVASTEVQTDIHALGFSTDFAPLQSKAKTFDSASWIAPLRYQTVYVFDPLKGMRKFRCDKVASTPFDKLPRELRVMFQNAGVNQRTLQSRRWGSTGLAINSFISAGEWFKWARLCEQNGQHYYFASVRTYMLIQLILAGEFTTKQGFNWPMVNKHARGLHQALELDNNLRVVEAHLDRAVESWNKFIQ